MFGSGPSTIDPIQLAKKGAHLRGSFPVAAMPRLVQLCRDDSGTVYFDLQFGRSEEEEGLYLVHGPVSASVRATCQRCLGPMTLDLAAEMRLILLRSGEREDLEQEGEALVIEGPVSLVELVEDELLLGMPMIPIHEPSACPARSYVRSKSAGAVGGKKGAGPFSALAAAKRKDK